MRADNDNKKQLDHPETAVIYNKFFLYRTDFIFQKCVTYQEHIF